MEEHKKTIIKDEPRDLLDVFLQEMEDKEEKFLLTGDYLNVNLTSFHTVS